MEIAENMKERKPRVQGAECERVYVQGTVESARGRQLTSNEESLYVQGKRLNPRMWMFEAEGGCAKWRGSGKTLCSKERC